VQIAILRATQRSIESLRFLPLKEPVVMQPNPLCIRIDAEPSARTWFVDESRETRQQGSRESLRELCFGSCPRSFVLQRIRLSSVGDPTTHSPMERIRATRPSRSGMGVLRSEVRGLGSEMGSCWSPGSERSLPDPDKLNRILPKILSEKGSACQ
jgi:hypothetical protein